MPKITVVVPAYNKVKYLPECLASIRIQTFTDWECLVVSDGSPHVREIYAAVADAMDGRFRVIELAESRGVSAARNRGIQESRADFIICVDEDDRIREDCLSVLLKEITNNNAEIVCPQGRFFGGVDRPRRARNPSLDEILASMPLLPVGSLVRRDVFDRIGCYDVNLKAREDHEWWIRVIKGNIKLHICDEELYFIRRPGGNDDLKLSLDFCSAEDEHRLWAYITEKHADVYRRYPDQRRRILRLGWVREADYHVLSGREAWAALCFWNAFLLSRTGKDLRRAIGAMVKWFFGGTFAGWVRRWLLR